MDSRFAASLLAPVAALVAAPCQAEVFFTLEQVQSALFPGEMLKAHPLELSKPQAKAIEKASGVRVRSREVHAWKSADGSWLLLDQVLGKHEFIQYAIAIDSAAKLRQVEIMEYRETYGGEVRNPKWRAQFVGKNSESTLKIDHDIQNVSGATLSCVHLTEGIRRLLATHAAVLRDA